MSDTASKPRTVDTYRSRRRPEIRPGEFREAGELVPEAHTWRLVDSLVHAGIIAEAKGVEEDEFRAAVTQYCPELEEQILPRVGLVDGVTLNGDRRTPVQTEQATPVLTPLKPTAKRAR